MSHRHNDTAERARGPHRPCREVRMTKVRFCGFIGATVALLLVGAAPPTQTAHAATTTGGLGFTTTPLLTADGNSEPEISIGNDGGMAMVGLQWLFNPAPGQFGTNLWTGPFGATPTFQGVIDAGLQHPGKTIFGAGDADVNIG